MGELVFIGLGLHDELGLSLRGREEAGSCNSLFLELYTSVMPGLAIGNLNKLVGREVKVLSRHDVEDDAEEVILSKARTGKVGFLVPGDPMVATTHVDLRLRAHKAGIRTRIVHAASVMPAAAGVTGLQSYKFGRTVTIPLSWQGAFPESIYLNIKSNLASGLHSLVLLEIDTENKKHISPPQALKQLLSVSEQRSENIINSGTLTVGIARLEASDMIVKAGTLAEVSQIDFGLPPFALILPGSLHFVEAEALHVLCGARRDLVSVKS
jgi:diphthine synthase